jgi:hypothetical protein
MHIPEQYLNMMNLNKQTVSEKIGTRYLQRKLTERKRKLIIIFVPNQATLRNYVKI